MHDYEAQLEVVRLALVIGILISMLVYERWHVSSGAVVVAGYLSLFVNRPLYILVTVLIGVATYLIVQRTLAQKVFLYGRRKLVVMVLIGMGLQLLTGAIAYLLTSSESILHSAPWVAGLYGIGFLLPGLIAQDMDRQGAGITLLAVAGVTVLTFLAVLAVEWVKPFMTPAATQAAAAPVASYSYPTDLLIPAAILSVILSALVFEKWGIRSGGFVTAAYIALFFFEPTQMLFIVIASLLVYLVVTRLLIPYIPIFGRTKFAVMVLTGVIITWLLEVLVESLTGHTVVPFIGFSIISPMIAALIANDGEHQGFGKTLTGVAACTIAVFILIKGVSLLTFI
jgi:poly-gamma-glutamate biosynthesis protein PgsC/CapC